ncbi:fructokinase [Streptomyces sp. LamerLS-316]|uniref:carbohydrate kinase family protein n=1 Tax=unclassified Streptomyces TaxID=2593676 RepID=UPI000823B5DF|nr:MULTISPECIES: carbohydrate kinase [unclassified Streptomyces]MYQ40990.1 carbohydrate kinase [Streptomyces sp. SID4921]SCK07017.1 fructokinase [Streptomyces sp. LamerLS-316]
MPDSPALLVIGECVADIVRLPGAPDRTHPGGSPANVAYGLARLGRDTTLVTQLGRDPDGRLIEDHLASAGVRVVTDGGDAPTPAATVELDDEGRATYSFRITWTLGPVALPGEPPRHVHTGSIATALDPGADTVLDLVRSLRGAATVSYDPNVRPALMGDHLSAVRRAERFVALSDIVKASDEDLRWLYPDEAPEKAAERWLGSGPSLVLLTRGAGGATAFVPGATVSAGAPPVRVADTVGAGDAFMSGTLHALASYGLIGAPGRARLRSPDTAVLDEVLRHALASAAVTVARAGALPPDEEELAAALTSGAIPEG